MAQLGVKILRCSVAKVAVAPGGGAQTKVTWSRTSRPEAIDTLARSVARARRVPWRASGTPTVAVHVSGVATGIGSSSRATTSPAKPGAADDACAPVITSAWQRDAPEPVASRQTRTPNTQVPSAL